MTVDYTVVRRGCLYEGEDVKMEAAEKIRRAYRRAGLTQQEAARICGVAAAQMNAWCTGRRTPNALTLESILTRIAKAGRRRQQQS